jgi:O-succinylhomoserine sulfhydrylase
MSPFNAWVLLKGLETLPLRVEKQTASAGQIAQAVSGHPAALRTIYPGLPSHPQYALAQTQMASPSTMIALDLKGGKAGAFAFCNALRVMKISNNLGDAKSIVTHPATTTHQRLTPEARAHLGITDGLVRLSIGLEDTDDLLEDITNALDAVR